MAWLEKDLFPLFVSLGCLGGTRQKERREGNEYVLSIKTSPLFALRVLNISMVLGQEGKKRCTVGMPLCPMNMNLYVCEHKITSVK